MKFMWHSHCYGNERDRRAVSRILVPTDGPTAFSKALPRKARQRAKLKRSNE